MKKFVVRYGAMRTLCAVECSEKESRGLYHGALAIVRTPRGIEAATVLCETNEEKLQDLPNISTEPARYLRRANNEDRAKLAEIQKNAKNDFERCLKIVTRMKIGLTLVRVEQILGHERVVVYYVADGRVDFRELVRALAAEFQTRIEMKQIGVRDETKLLADVGDCGREVCCNTYLANMPPVSMKMAKLQKATLDPTKVSGRCGRLKCCLRYEYDTYVELQEAFPPTGQYVSTSMGPGVVFTQELFAKKVVVDLEEGGRQSFPLEEVKTIDNPNGERRSSIRDRRKNRDGEEEDDDYDYQEPFDEVKRHRRGDSRY